MVLLVSPMRGCCVGQHVNFGLEYSSEMYTKLWTTPANATPGASFRPGGLDGYLPAVIDHLALEMGFTYVITLDKAEALYRGLNSGRLDALLTFESTAQCSAEL